MFFKKFMCVFILMISSCLNIQGETYDEIVSLGSACQVAWHLKANNLRSRAYPLDQVNTPFPGLLLFLSMEGKDFLDIDKIKIIDPLSDKDHLRIVDLTTGIICPHDVELDFSNYDAVKDKYNYRIERLFNLLKSDKKILLIRNGGSRKEIEDLNNLLQNAYPNLNYDILAIDSRKEYRKPWNIKHIKNFYISPRATDPKNRWVGDSVKWREILSEFSTIPDID